MKTNYRLLFSLMVAGMLLTSCGSKKSVRTTKPKTTTSSTADKTTPVVVTDDEDKVTTTTSPRSKDKVANYIDDFKDIAMKEMKLYKIPASITLAQGVLESGSETVD